MITAASILAELGIRNRPTDWHRRMPNDRFRWCYDVVYSYVGDRHKMSSRALFDLMCEVGAHVGAMEPDQSVRSNDGTAKGIVLNGPTPCRHLEPGTRARLFNVSAA